MRRRPGKKSAAVAATSVLAITAAIVIQSPFREQLVRWTDTNPEPLPIECLTKGDGLPHYQSFALSPGSQPAAPTLEDPATGLLMLPKTWACSETKCRLVGDVSFGFQKSAWSNTVRQPTGCELVRYVPEPPMLLGLSVGAILLVAAAQIVTPRD